MYFSDGSDQLINLRQRSGHRELRLSDSTVHCDWRNGEGNCHGALLLLVGEHLAEACELGKRLEWRLRHDSPRETVSLALGSR